MIEHKNDKTKSMRTLNFLEGALITLRYIYQVKTFNEVIEFKEFIMQAERLMHEESRVQQEHKQYRQHTKENYNEFCSQLGKLKGYQFFTVNTQGGNTNEQ